MLYHRTKAIAQKKNNNLLGKNKNWLKIKFRYSDNEKYLMKPMAYKCTEEGVQ